MVQVKNLVLKGTVATVGAYGVSVGLRFGTNVVLSRLVMPEVFGVMLIINTLRNGVELLTDVGIGQNVVQNPKGETRSFRDVAWTIQVLRGLALFSLLFIAAAPLGQLYQLPAPAIQLIALTLAISGGASLSIYLMQRRLQFIRLNLFDLSIDAINAILVVGLAFLSPTIWSLILANIVSVVIRAGATYLLPEARTWFAWHREHAREIFSFGKWIYFASMLAFLCASFDKLYLGQSIPLALLGIYGLARNVADLPAMLFARLGHTVVFPLISAQQHQARQGLRARIFRPRLKLLLLGAAALALAISVSDFAIMIIYDTRYHDAAWMLPIMLLGVWVTMLCSLNDYIMLGIGKPVYGAAGNLAKLAGLVLGLPLALHFGGILAVLVAVGLADCLRYVPILVGQRREHISFVLQDIFLTTVLLLMTAALIALRYLAGFGTPFDGAVLP